MASNEKDDFENDWTFVDREGKVDIEPRKNSVSYSKPLQAKDEVLVSPTEVPDKDDSEGEAESEVLTGFQCHPPSIEEVVSAQDLQRVESNEQSDENSDVYGEKSEDQLVPVQQNGCQCAAADGIMIISNHFCMNDETDSTSNDDDVDIPVTLECEQDCTQENLPSSCAITATTDGWENPPQLSESGSYSFPSDSNSSEEDNDIEPIPEEDNSQDFVELGHDVDTLDTMVDSKNSLFSFDSDLFNPSDLDEDVCKGQDDTADIVKLSEAGGSLKESDQNEGESTDITEDLHVTTDNCSYVSFDLPTLFLLLGITTALGFSIGYGLSIYISSQALEVTGNVKRPGPKTASLPLTSDSMERLDEVSRDFLDQLTMWKIEDRLDSHRDPEPENDLGDLFDTKALHEKLQQKHFRLTSLHESVKQRLRMSRVMSWYWRLKYEEEKSKKEGGGEWNKALQEQLEHMEQLYLHEKHTADLWRRMNENAKLRRAVANGIKFDKYWKDFLNRWKKSEDRGPVNESQKLTHPSEVDKNPEEELSAIKAKELEQNERSSSRVHDNMWREFRDRWTKDLRLKGRKKESSSVSTKCASDDPEEKNYLLRLSGKGSVTKVSRETKISPWYTPIFMEGLVKRSVEDASKNHDHEDDKVVTPLTKHNVENQDNGEEIAKEFTKGPQFDNPLFPRESVSWFHDKTPRSLKADSAEQLRMPADRLPLTETYVKDFWCPKRAGEAEKVSRYVLGNAISSLKKVKTVKRHVSDRGRINGEKDTAAQSFGALKATKVYRKDEANVQLQRLLTEQKQMLRNLSKDRGEGIRKHMIQRRELKKKEKKAKLRVEEADRYLLKLKQERRGLEIEKKKLRRSWKALARSKKKLSVEREIHEKDKQGLEKFIAALKQEKQKLKKLKTRLKKMKELLAKQSELLKLKKKTLDANKKKEVERLRSEITQEKDKLRKQQKVLKSLKKAVKEKYKKWSSELRQMKTEKEKQRRKREQAKKRKKAKKKGERAERERQQKQEYESVVREQAKYDKEKRRRKGEASETVNEKIEKANWKKSDDHTSEKEGEQSRGSQAKTEGGHREAFFRQQLEKVKEWLSRVREKTLERQQKTFSQMENLKQWLSGVHKKTLKKAEEFHWRTLFVPSIFGANRGAETPTRNAGEQDKFQGKELQNDKTSEDNEENSKSNVEARQDHPRKLSYWEAGKKELQKLMFGIEKREFERKENEKREVTVRNSELARVSEDRALAGLLNLTFDIDLVKTLLKGLERKDKTTSDNVRAADSKSFIIISKESDDIRSSGDSSDVQKKKMMGKNLKCAKGHPWMLQGPTETGLSQEQDKDWTRKETPEGPIPPEGIRLSSKIWYEKRHKVKTGRQEKVGAQGPVLSDVRSGDARDRHRGYAQDKVCISDDTEKAESIPPPDWVFQRARERAKERADQWSVPWYDLRAQNRNSQRSKDEHNTQFPCGHHWEPQDEPAFFSWYDQRAQERCYQRNTDTHDTRFLSDGKFKHRKEQRSVPWYDRRAQERDQQRSSDKHETQFPCGQKQKRGQNWFFERASDRAHQRSNYVPWYFRRADGRQSQRREELDPWFVGSGHYRDHFRDWMPQGPSMDEHC